MRSFGKDELLGSCLLSMCAVRFLLLTVFFMRFEEFLFVFVCGKAILLVFVVNLFVYIF